MHASMSTVGRPRWRHLWLLLLIQVWFAAPLFFYRNPRGVIDLGLIQWFLAFDSLAISQMAGVGAWLGLGRSPLWVRGAGFIVTVGLVVLPLKTMPRIAQMWVVAMALFGLATALGGWLLRLRGFAVRPLEAWAGQAAAGRSAAPAGIQRANQFSLRTVLFGTALAAVGFRLLAPSTSLLFASEVSFLAGPVRLLSFLAAPALALTGIWWVLGCENVWRRGLLYTLLAGGLGWCIWQAHVAWPNRNYDLYSGSQVHGMGLLVLAISGWLVLFLLLVRWAGYRWERGGSDSG